MESKKKIINRLINHLTMKNIKEMLTSILLDIGLVESQIKEEANLMYDLGLDSLDIAEMIMLIEGRLQISIPNGDWEKLRTIKEIINYLEEKQKIVT